jgi:hypothetical protein
MMPTVVKTLHSFAFSGAQKRSIRLSPRSREQIRNAAYKYTIDAAPNYSCNCLHRFYPSSSPGATPPIVGTGARSGCAHQWVQLVRSKRMLKAWVRPMTGHLSRCIVNTGPKVPASGLKGAVTTDSAIVTETMLKVLRVGSTFHDEPVARVTPIYYEARAGQVHQPDVSGDGAWKE